jgi:hypothetical protein
VEHKRVLCARRLKGRDGGNLLGNKEFVDTHSGAFGVGGCERQQTGAQAGTPGEGRTRRSRSPTRLPLRKRGYST